MSKDKWKVESTSDSKTLKTVVEEIENGLKGKAGILLDPEYQRDYKYTKKEESLLIESLLMGIPIPVIYLSSDVTQDPYISNVIDGQHRLRAVYRYLNNKFSLTGLKKKSDLNGYKFNDLKKEIQNKLLFQSRLSFENIHIQNNPELELEIFKRYNQGTNPLKPQEIRHAVYRSKFNKWMNNKVDEFYNDDKLKEIFNISKYRYSNKSAHESVYIMTNILLNGLNDDFRTSPEYAEDFMKYAVNYENQDELISNVKKRFTPTVSFLVKVYDQKEVEYPFSKEIYGVQSRNYKVQKPIVMVVSSFLYYLFNNKIDILIEKNFNKIYKVINNVMSDSYLEKPLKGSNTNPKFLKKASSNLIKMYNKIN